MEFLDINIFVLVNVDLVEDILQSEVAINQNLDHLVEDFILRVLLLFFFLKHLDHLLVVFVEESF